jgi:hypothetical protein
MTMGNPQYGPPQGQGQYGPQSGYGPPQGGFQPGPPQQGYGPPQGYQGGYDQGGYGQPAPVDWDRWSQETDPGAGGGSYHTGWADAVLAGGELGRTRNGDKDAFKLSLKITGGPDAGRKINDTEAISEVTQGGERNFGGMAALFRRLTALGIPCGEKWGDPPGTRPWWHYAADRRQAAALAIQQAVAQPRPVQIKISDSDYGFRVDDIRPAAAQQAPAGSYGPPGPPAPQPGPQGPPPYGGVPQPAQGPPQGQWGPAGGPGTEQFTPQGQAAQPWTGQPPQQGPPQGPPPQGQQPWNGGQPGYQQAAPQGQPQPQGPQPGPGGPGTPPWLQQPQ